MTNFEDIGGGFTLIDSLFLSTPIEYVGVFTIACLNIVINIVRNAHQCFSFLLYALQRRDREFQLNEHPMAVELTH